MNDNTLLTVVKGNDAIGVRKVYQSLVEEQKLRIVFRPFQAKYRNLYDVGALVELRVILRPGSQFAGLEPVYSPERYWVKIISVDYRYINTMTVEQYKHSSPDVKNNIQLLYHLGMIYNKSVEDIQKEPVTVIRFEYVTDVHLIKELNSL